MIGGHPLSFSALQWGERERWLLELLACPDCRAPLLEAEGVLACGGCGQQYAVTNGIPQLLPSALTTGTPTDPAWRAWAAALDRLVAWRRRTWNGGAAAKTLQGVVHGIQTEFAAHCQLGSARGSVLDVGCGNGGITAVLPPDCRYIGVDPLPLPSAGGPPMVRGVAERLPFRASAFDLVLILETLDHCQSPAATVEEVLRVLKPGGTLCVEQYVTTPGWGTKLVRWWRGPSTPGRPAPADSSKVVLLDAVDLLALLEPAFGEVAVGRAAQGTHVFVAARKKRDGSLRS